MSALPDPQIRDRIETLLSARIVTATPVHGGYTPAERWVVDFGAGRAFAKVATTELTGTLLRREAIVYQRLRAPFMPRLIAWQDHVTRPILLIEDLSTARWPSRWTAEDVGAVVSTLRRLHELDADLPSYAQVHGSRSPGWRTVAADPTPFLSLGSVDETWLSRHLPTLLDAEAGCDPSGNAVTHWDVRSDNICITDHGAILVDWAEACRSNAKLDLGFWLPSLAFEGGPAPEDILPDEPGIAAWVAGFFAARAGLPGIPDAPRVRKVQLEQLSTALPWAARALGLRSPVG
jgi:hypothetical protein